MSSEIALFPPGSSAPALQPGAVPYAHLLGTWHVVATTLPLWRDKKNVAISYAAIAGEPATTFDDLVEYNKRTDAVGKAPSRIKGVDRLEPGAGARWKWRGKGLLMIATSQWQLLGFNVAPASSPALASPEWVVTYFASTLFTPAGLDIYARGAHTLSDEFVAQLVAGIEQLGGEMAALVKDGKMFRVPHDA